MIYLINPPALVFHARSSRWGGRKNRSGILAPPIYLATASAYLNNLKVPAEVIDMCALRYNKKDLDNFIKRCTSLDIIVFEVSTSSLYKDAEIANYIKSRVSSKIVFVGAHVTVLPEETLRKHSVDFVCLGEYEQTLYDIYKALNGELELGSIQGVAYLDKNGRFVKTSSRKLLDLNDIPFPQYEQLPIDAYYDPIARNRKYMSIISSRGCAYKCKFCVEPQIMFRGKVRYRNPKIVVDEIEYLVRKYSIKEIFFDDSTFTLNKKHVKEICDEIKRRNLKVDWSCFARVDHLDKDLLKCMKSSGCYMLRVGVESMDDNILKSMNKEMKSIDIIKGINLINDIGLKVHLTVMFGFPGGTHETVEKMFNFVMESGADYAQFSIATPYPGTAFFKEMQELDKINSYNWQDYDGTCKSVIKLEEFESKDLSNILDDAYKRFYLSPFYICKHILSIRKIDEFRYLLKSGYNLLKSQLT